jgi:hypothetical protein
VVVNERVLVNGSSSLQPRGSHFGMEVALAQQTHNGY